MKNKIFKIVLGLLVGVVLFVSGLGLGIVYGSMTTSAKTVEKVVVEYATVVITSEPKVIRIELPTSTPNPTQIVKADGNQHLFDISGTGGVVTDNFVLSKCFKAVFTATSYGDDNLVAYLVNIDTQDYPALVANIYPAGTEQVFLPLRGGNYFLNVELGPQAGWNIKAECKD